MKLRPVLKALEGQPAIDGAGVRLVRVLGHRDTREFDPFLMLDSFDSTNPEDYIRGFPTHPHRGIETITYLIEGEMEHQDSLGNKGVISAGCSQWMTAGSGILHQEMPKASPRMLGLQIWLNLPQGEKMAPPAYFDITPQEMAEVREDFGTLRVISGSYGAARGIVPRHHPATLYDVTLAAGKEATLPTAPEDNVFVFLILGEGEIGGRRYREKTAVLFGPGEAIALKAPEEPCRFLYFAGKKLEEPISWGGPIVMNTKQELQKAFEELEQGTFIKEGAREPKE